MARLATVVLAVSLLATATAVEAAISWTTVSTIDASVTSAPVKLALGNGASRPHYFSPPLTLSANETVASGTFKAPAGADARVKDVLRLVETTAASQSVTLAATQIGNARVETFTWTVKDGNTVVATLDAKDGTPSASFTLPASTTYKLDLRVDMADGAGLDNSPSSFDLRIVIG